MDDKMLIKFHFVMTGNFNVLTVTQSYAALFIVSWLCGLTKCDHWKFCPITVHMNKKTMRDVFAQKKSHLSHWAPFPPAVRPQPLSPFPRRVHPAAWTITDQQHLLQSSWSVLREWCWPAFRAAYRTCWTPCNTPNRPNSSTSEAIAAALHYSLSHL